MTEKAETAPIDPSITPTDLARVTTTAINAVADVKDAEIERLSAEIERLRGVVDMHYKLGRSSVGPAATARALAIEECAALCETKPDPRPLWVVRSYRSGRLSSSAGPFSERASAVDMADRWVASGNTDVRIEAAPPDAPTCCQEYGNKLAERMRALADV